MSTPAQKDDRENLEFKWVKKRGFGGKKKEVQFYESFIYDGVYYELFDCVYLCKDGEPEPYIGKIIKIWEIIQIKIRKVKILWFFRPCEIVNWLGDEEPPEDELFLACGEGSGVANVNPLEAISGKCNVVCISKDSRNPQPSEEDLKSADFKFQRMFDVQTHTIIDKIVKVCLVEVESIFNKKHKSNSIGDPKSYPHDVHGHSVVRDVIEKEEEKGENIAGKLLVNEVRDETKVKSLKNSDELNIRPLKKVKVDGSTQLVEDEKVNVLDKRCVNSDKNNVSLVEADGNVNKVLSQLEDEKKVKATKVMVKPKNVFEDGNMKKSANDLENGKKVNPQKSIDADKVKSKEIDVEKKGKYLEVVRDGKKEKLKKVFVDEKTTKSSKGIEDGTKANLIEMTNGLDVMAFNKSSAYETSPLGVGKRDMLFSHYVGDVMNKKSKNDIDELEIRSWKKARVESSTEQPVEKKGNEDLKLPTHSYVGEKLANKGEDRSDQVLVNGNEECTKVNASSTNVSIGQDQTSTIKNSKGGGSVKKGNVKQVVKDNSITKLVKTSSQVEALLSKKIKLDKQTSNLSSGKLVKAHSSKQPNMEGKLANQIIYVTRRPDALGGFIKFMTVSFFWGFFQWFYSAGSQCGFSQFPTFGLKARKQSFYFDFSSTYIGTGMICSHLVNFSLLLGAVLSWGVMWPLISDRRGIWFPSSITENSMKSLNGYKVFLSISLLLGDALYNFIKIVYFTAKSIHATRRLPKGGLKTNLEEQNQSLDDPHPDEVFTRGRIPVWIACAGYVLLSVISIIALPVMFHELKWYYIVVAYTIAPVLCFANAYGTGLTDMNMAYNYGKTALFILAALGGERSGVVAGLLGCGLVKTIVHISSQLMQDLKTSHLTLTSPRSMLISQAIGTAMGCILGPLSFFLFYKAFDIGNPNGEYKAPYALIYRNVAIIGVEGFSALPHHCLQLCYGFFAFAVIINLLRDLTPEKIANWVPIPIAMAYPFLVGASFTIDMCLGSVVVFLWNKINSNVASLMVPAVASGLICGDGLWILPSSILALAGIKPPICMTFLSS